MILTIAPTSGRLLFPAVVVISRTPKPESKQNPKIYVCLTCNVKANKILPSKAKQLICILLTQKGACQQKRSNGLSQEYQRTPLARLVGLMERTPRSEAERKLFQTWSLKIEKDRSHGNTRVHHRKHHRSIWRHLRVEECNASSIPKTSWVSTTVFCPAARHYTETHTDFGICRSLPLLQQGEKNKGY